MLFKTWMRTDTAPRRQRETYFKFTDRSVQLYKEKERLFLNHWLAKLPAEQADHLINKIKNNNDSIVKEAIEEVVTFAYHYSEREPMALPKNEKPATPLSIINHLNDYDSVEALINENISTTFSTQA